MKRKPQAVDESGMQIIESEDQDAESEPAQYDIVTFPADYTLEGLVDKYRKNLIEIPGYQRKFVWTIKQASRLIESFLMGLPVPAIFLHVDPKEGTHTVIDGQQRLLSICFFFEGLFGPEERGKRDVFTLQSLNEKSPYSGKSYKDLQAEDPASINRLNDSVLRAFIVKQLNPQGDSSVYHIFERLNTGGTQLVGQEIRNCVYHGPFNELLNELNLLPGWRKLFGRIKIDKRLRDVELILRFFALFYSEAAYRKPMKEFLNSFMKARKSCGQPEIKKYRNLFEETTDALCAHLGEKPFHIHAGLNAAVFDAVCCAFARDLHRIPRDIKRRFKKLLNDDGFKQAVSSATTDEDTVKTRMKTANDVLFG